MNTTIIASKCHMGHVLMISNTTHLIICKTKSTVNCLIIHHFLLLAQLFIGSFMLLARQSGEIKGFDEMWSSTHLFLHYLVFRKSSMLTRP